MERGTSALGIVLRRVLAVACFASAAAAALVVLASAAAAQSRPFQHLRHERLACTECHGVGAQHGQIRVRRPADCAGCHHDERRRYACADCHDGSAIPVRNVASPMGLSVWPEERLRPLPFEHARHAALECRTCHVTPVTLRPQAECRSCHANHHRPEAECAQCHRRTDPPAHRRESHLTCAGSACHAPAVRERLTMSRNLCVVCHLEQRQHEPDRNCAPCHLISRPPAQAAF